MKRSEVLLYRSRIEMAAKELDDISAVESVSLFPSWKPGIQVSVGERYKYNGLLYKVIQAHTTLAVWPPDITPALFTRISIDEWPEWVQPTGAQDAYMTGDKVSHNEKHWTSSVDNNVWEPGVYGWNEV